MSALLKSMFILALLLSAGCSSNGGKPETKDESDDINGFLLSKEPTGAKGIVKARAALKDGDEVVLEGMIGGSGKPFTKGKAAFTLIDLSKTPCDDDGCGNPWCGLDKKEKLESTVYVKLVDASGRTPKQDADEALGLKMQQTVVVVGKVQLDGDGAVTVLASGLHVRK